MGHIVVVVRMSLTVATEVKIGTDCALVADTLDIRLPRLLATEFAIAVDALVLALDWSWKSQWLVDWNESMRMCSRSVGMASSANVEVWAGETLVADAVDRLRNRQL